MIPLPLMKETSDYEAVLRKEWEDHIPNCPNCRRAQTSYWIEMLGAGGNTRSSLRITSHHSAPAAVPRSRTMALVAHGVFGPARQLGPELVVKPGQGDRLSVMNEKRDHFGGA